MKILLINPANKDDILRKAVMLPPLSLMTLASYLPKDADIRIIDENKELLKKGMKADLVLISSLTYNAPRAYRIAKYYRMMGTKVILGGIHPSMMPTEAIRYADSVVTGEAETVIKDILEDFRKNKLKRFYNGSQGNIADIRPPDRTRLRHSYTLEPIQTSRGCPCNCNFCSVTQFNGRQFRRRPVKSILREIDSLKNKKIFFVDDNIIGISKEEISYSKMLFKSLSTRNIRWASQCSMNVAEHPKLLRAIADSGCESLLIGFESFSSMTLKKMGKGINQKIGVANYKSAVKKLHDHGISVNGTIVIGNDTDTISSIKAIPSIIDDLELDRSQITISTPLPGTALFESMRPRIFRNSYPRDWKYYDCGYAVFRPKNMTSGKLEELYNEIYDNLGNLAFRRFYTSFKNTGNLRVSVRSLFYNMMITKAVQKRYSAMSE